jgi:hypothetical protein
MCYVSMLLSIRIIVYVRRCCVLFLDIAYDAFQPFQTSHVASSQAFQCRILYLTLTYIAHSTCIVFDHIIV